MMHPLDWSRVRGVIFDLDGTLYDAGPIKRRMALELGRHLLADPRRVSLLRVLHRFRQERERLAESEAAAIRRLQYERPALALGVAPEVVAGAVESWILERPLRHLRRSRAQGVGSCFELLRRSGRALGVLSDYPAEAKLTALGLAADIVISAVDPEVDRLKPHPAGLDLMLARLGLDPEQCLLVGDRDERDGELARRVGMPYRLRAARASRNELTFSEYSELTSGLAASLRREPRS